MPEPEIQEKIQEKGKGNAASAGRNEEEPPVVPGLADLIEFINAMGATPPRGQPQLHREQVERIEKSPLRPALQALRPIYRMLFPSEGSSGTAQTQAQVPEQPEAIAPTPQPASTLGPGSWRSTKRPTPAAAPAAAGITKTEAGLKLVSSKLNSVSQAVTDMKNSTKTAKDQVEAARDQVEAVEKRVSQISGQLDPAITELTQEVKRLQVDLIGDFKGERTRLETKVKGLEAEVNRLNKVVSRLDSKVVRLEKEGNELQQVIHNTGAELLGVEVASEMAVRGTFIDEPGKTGGRKGTDKASGDVLQTAKKVRTNASNSKLRNAAAEKEEIFQDIQFVGLVLDQIRRGNRVRLVSQASPRPTGQPDAASNNPASSAATAMPEASTNETAISVTQGRTTLSDLNACGYLS
ncbi:hypothetical protein FRC00_000493 [Tulasnella sp. 408]|nr:hypothetical protein FRC00_000493 [Tulasnella sp. 408]